MPCVTAPPFPRFLTNDTTLILPAGIFTACSARCVQGPDKRRGRDGSWWVRAKPKAVSSVASLEPSSISRISQPLLGPVGKDPPLVLLFVCPLVCPLGRRRNAPSSPSPLVGKVCSAIVPYSFSK